MKTKTTKLSVLAFLGLGLVVYGQDYSGKVGINIDKPNATLEIKGKSDNTDKTLEGLIIPNVSKNKAHLMTTNTEMPLKESTLVYVNDLTMTNAATPAVVDITEKGYYFWNGTKWVKSAGSTNGEIWQKQANGNVKLTDADIPNNVYYKPNGGYVLTPINTVETKSFDKSTKQYYLSSDPNSPSNATIPGQYTQRYSQESNQAQNIVTDSTTFFYNKVTDFTLDQNTPPSLTAVYVNGIHASIDNLNTKDYSNITLNRNVFNHNGKGNVQFLASNASSLLISPESKFNRAYTNRNILEYYSTQNGLSLTDNQLFNNDNHATIKGSGSIRGYIGNRNYTTINDTDITIHSLSLNTNQLMTNFFSGQINNIYGSISYMNKSSNSTGSIVNAYAFYASDITLANNNYAIYTNKGINRFGDDIKLSIYANDDYYATIGRGFTNGAGLSFKAHSQKSVADLPTNYIDFDFKNEVDPTQNGIVRFFRGTNLQGRKYIDFYKGDGTVSTVARISSGEHLYISVESGVNFGVGTISPTEKLEVAGSVKATGFIGANAAIFPDYVFQKYYTGTSSIKADYNFKTLSQVEDFVKTNGHLPGYQSAEAIKKQGYIDLMATQLTNVEKIEELYLHSIEQDKALKAKDTIIKELKSEVSNLEARLQKLEALLVK
ncbi:hypothetical protein D1Z98_09290 [Riemerella anatipestifer]|uniref:hypothetical protein n=1 Tax=Riemerella anatipestifer TaxID=34085 RepID=UPI00129E42B4|nr:hypothetical protein [Riemerella anatipestifer]MRM95152.1 hypothetical protein [Riemerella anatipestifer]